MARTAPRSAAALCLAATIAFGGASAAGAAEATRPSAAVSISTKTARADLLRLVNNARRAHGLHKVALHPQASGVAQKHSRQMARQGHVASSRNLPRAIHRWLRGAWGENVTCGVSPWTVHRAFLHDRDARRNMLRRGIRFVGIGVVRTKPKPRACSGGGLWVTEILFE